MMPLLVALMIVSYCLWLIGYFSIPLIHLFLCILYSNSYELSPPALSYRHCVCIGGPLSLDWSLWAGSTDKMSVSPSSTLNKNLCMAAGLEMNGELKLRAADCKNDKMAYICQVKHRDGSFDKPPTPSPKPQATTAAQTTAATPAQTTTATPVQTTTATPAQTATTTPAHMNTAVAIQATTATPVTTAHGQATATAYLTTSHLSTSKYPSGMMMFCSHAFHFHCTSSWLNELYFTTIICVSAFLLIANSTFVYHCSCDDDLTLSLSALLLRDGWSSMYHCFLQLQGNLEDRARSPTQDYSKAERPHTQVDNINMVTRLPTTLTTIPIYHMQPQYPLQTETWKILSL